jgi:ketosteroid isomerase-like protein
MQGRKQVVETYFEGFRRGDHAMILRCLTDDVEWNLPGYKHLRGKVAFDAEIENPDFSGRPTLTVDRLVEEEDTVVAIGQGEAALRTGQRFRFAFCTVLTFAGDRIGRVESYVVPLAGST